MDTKLTLCVVAVLLLNACAVQYKQPKGENVARIRVSAPQTAFTASVSVMGYSSGTCENAMNLGLVGGYTVYEEAITLNMPKSAEFKSKRYIERLIPASKRYMMSFRKFTPASYCYMTYSFIPQAKQDYEITISWDHKNCYTRLGRLAEDSNRKVRLFKEQSFKREKTCSKGFS